MLRFGQRGRPVALAVLLALSVSGIGTTAALADYSNPGSTGCATTPAGYPNLGAAAGYTVFALNGLGTKQAATFSNDTVNGNVAVAGGASGTNQSPSTINGNVSVDTAGSFSGTGRVSGSVLTNQMLASARSLLSGVSVSFGGCTPGAPIIIIPSTW